MTLQGSRDVLLSMRMLNKKAVLKGSVCTGQAPVAWAIGARCQAYSSLDGNWYTARVTGVSASENFVVQLEDGGPEEEVRHFCSTPNFLPSTSHDAELKVSARC